MVQWIGKFLLLASSILLMSCEGRQLQMSLRASGEIRGSADMFASQLGSSIEYQACNQGEVTLHTLNDQGGVSPEALLRANIESDGSFRLAGATSKGVELDTELVKYVLKASGCGHEYFRPLTQFTAQNISGGSTLIVLTTSENNAPKKLSTLARAEVETAINQFPSSDEGDLNAILEQIIADPSLSQTFNQLTATPPAQVKDLAPTSWTLTVPAVPPEGTVTRYAAQIQHWNSQYQTGAQWILDGQVVANSTTWDFETGKNSQGQKQLVVRIGSNTSGGVLDSTKPYREETLQIRVNDTYPAVAPPMLLNGAFKRNTLNGSLQILTGATRSNCESFSSLALSESPYVAPVSSGSYNILCTQAVTQTQNFTLSSGDGLKTLSLWAKDASGQISSASSQVQVLLDQTPPVLSLGSLSLAKGNGTINLSLSAQDPTSGMDQLKLQFSEDGSAYTDVSSLSVNATSYTWTSPGIDVSTARLRLVGTDRAGNQSQLTSAAFVIDSTAPNVAITAPTANTPSQNGVNLSGSCETGLNVQLGGTGASAPLTTSCSSGSFSQYVGFSGSDGVKNITVSQTDAAGNTTTQNRNFIKDTTPPVLGFAGPAAGTAARNGVLVVGTCEDGLSITISGAGVAANSTTSCVNSEFSASVLFSTGDGAKNIQLGQTDAAGNVGSVQRNFVRDSLAPSLALSAPAEGASVPGNFSLVGICDDAGGNISIASASLSGSPLSVACSSGNFSRNLNLTGAEGSHSLTVSQTDAATVTTTINLNLVKDTVAPALTLSSPSANARFQSQAVLTGTCETGRPVVISGTGLANAGSATCTSSAFSFTAELTANEGTKSLSLLQADAAGNETQVNIDVVRDNTPPTLTISSHSQNSLTQEAITLTGTCENGGSDIVISGSDLVAGATVPCASGNFNSGSLTLTAPDGNKTIRISQNDVAGNTGTLDLVLVRDMTPPVLTKTAPADLSAWQNVVTFTGTCENSRVVQLTGTGLASSASATCNSGLYSIVATLSNGEGTKSLTLSELDGVGNRSEINFNLVRDNTVPVLTQNLRSSPAYSNADSVSFGGTCETGLPVVVSGANSTSVSCSSGTWTYPTNKSIDGVYNYTFSQTDDAGNSSSVNASWTRDKVLPAVTLTSPSAGTSTQSGLTLSGACETGLDVKFTGTGLLSTITIPCVGGSYSQWVYLSATDGTKAVSVSQTDLATNTTTVSRGFALDTTPPNLTQTLRSLPYSNNQNTASFGGACESGVSVQVSGADTSSVNCTSSVWTYTTSAQATDASRSYTFKQVDAAGNQTELTVSWIRDTVAPAFTMTSNSSFATSGNEVNFQGTCETNSVISVSGAATANFTCLGGNWSYKATATSDSNRTYNFTATDLAGNTASLTGTWQRSTQGPTITITQSSPQTSNGSTLDISGTCSGGSAGSNGNIVISGAGSTTITCPSTTTAVANWNHTLTAGSDGTFNYTFTVTDQFTTPRSSSATLSWVRDTTAPQISTNSFRINGGINTTTSLSYNPVQFSATDNLSKVTKFCLKDNSTTPAVSDSCWISLNGAPLNMTPATSVSVSGYSFNIGVVPRTYTISLWVMDGAANISSSSATSGTGQVDIELTPISPPVVSNVIAGKSDTMNGSSSERLIAGGADVFIRWTASGNSLSASPVQIFFSTDDVTWTSIANNLNNGVNNCFSVTGSGSASSSATGCYKWANGSPSGNYYRVRVGVKNTAGALSFGASLPINAEKLQVLAGNTEMGLGGSAGAAIFMPDYTDANISDSQNIVVNSKGQIFFRDPNQGIIQINPADGKVSLLIPSGATTSSVGDGGSIYNAKLRKPTKMALDFQDRLLILDYDRIRRVDFSANPATIQTFIGGGSSTAATQPNARNLKFSNTSLSMTGQAPLIPLPNGDLVFRSEESVARHYHAADQSITSIFYSGSATSSYGNNFSDLSKCINNLPVLSFDLTDETKTQLFGMARGTQSTTGCLNPMPTTSASPGSMFKYDLGTGSVLPVTIARYGTNSAHTNNLATIQSMNGEIYLADRARLVISRYRPSENTWETVIGTGSEGSCEDGVEGTACNLDPGGAFVDSRGQLYFLDRGKIKTLVSGKVVTVYGQDFSYGENGLASNARFGRISAVAQRSDGAILAVDEISFRLFMFNRGGNLTRIAGTGENSQPSTSLAAKDQPIYTQGNGIFVSMILDSLNGIYYGMSGKIFHLPGAYSSDPTTRWRLVNPSGSYAYSNIANSGRPLAEINLNTNYAYPLAYSGSSIMSLFSQTNSANRLYGEIGTDSNPIFTMATNSYTDNTTTCASGILMTDCMQYSPSASRAGAYDPVTQKWLALDGTRKSLISFSSNRTGTLERPMTVSSLFTSFVFKRFSGRSNAFVYYCTDAGRIVLRDLDAGSEVELPWPIASMKCTGMQMAYDESRDSLIFPFTQGGLYGIAELLGAHPADNGF